MRWIWIRHGQTEENREKRYIGHYNPPLNAAGIQQIERLHSWIKEQGIDFVVTSDLLRCVQTAELLMEGSGRAIICEPALRELHFGQWEGLTYEQIMEKDEKHARSWFEQPKQVAPPDGETLSALECRVDTWMTEWIRKHSKATTVIVTHGGVIRSFYSRWVAKSPRSFWQAASCQHGEALVTEYDGKRWRLIGRERGMKA